MGVAVGVDVSVHEQKYKQLSGKIRGELDFLLKELRALKQGGPQMKAKIELIEKFLAEF